MRIIIIGLVAAAVSVTPSAAGVSAPANVIGEATGAALQADGRRALDLIKAVDPKTLDEKDRQFVTCMQARLGPTSVVSEPVVGNFVDRVLADYQAYWHSGLMRPETRDLEERRLETKLRGLLNVSRDETIDSLETKLAKRLRAGGWHSLEGQTGLLRDLMIWRRQDRKLMPVALPEGKYRTTVFLLDGFKSFGWSHYATCGRRATGGWATDAALYAVVPRYESLDSEEFRVTFLGHETQHFADKARFRDLKPWELEYRAKLVELALAQKTRGKILTKFVEDQGANPASPHSYANHAVLSALMSRLNLSRTDDLFIVGLGKLQMAARELLLEDSNSRRPGAKGQR